MMWVTQGAGMVTQMVGMVTQGVGMVTQGAVGMMAAMVTPVGMGVEVDMTIP